MTSSATSQNRPQARTDSRSICSSDSDRPPSTTVRDSAFTKEPFSRSYLRGHRERVLTGLDDDGFRGERRVAYAEGLGTVAPQHDGLQQGSHMYVKVRRAVRRTPRVLAGILLALAFAGPAWASTVDVQAVPDAASGETRFEFSAYDDDGRTAFGATASLQITRDDTLIEEQDFEDDQTQTFVWECDALGRYDWTVVVTMPDKSLVVRTGRLKVPGPCARRARLLRRATVLGFATDELRDRNVVLERECWAWSRVLGGRARVWRCAVVWLTGPRLCGAPYEIRKVQTIRFGVVRSSEWEPVRLGRIICKRY